MTGVQTCALPIYHVPGAIGALGAEQELYAHGIGMLNAGFIERDVMAAIASAKAVINLAEAVPSARRTTAGQAGGSVDLDQSAAQLLADIVKNAGPKTVTVAFGNPYIGAQIPGIGTYLCTFSNTPGSATSLIKALFGELPIHGRLPVSVPGIAQRGVGLDR